MRAEIKCVQYNTWKPVSEIGTTRTIKGHGSTRCKQCVIATKDGDFETVNSVPDEIDTPVNFEHGYCKCGNIDGLIDGKCNECIDASVARKNKAVRHQPEAAAKPVDMVARQSVVNEVCLRLKASGRIR